MFIFRLRHSCLFSSCLPLLYHKRLHVCLCMSALCAAFQEKKIGQLRKYPNQPVVGFRFVGMNWSSFFEGDQQPEKVSMGKEWGAKMAVEETGGGLAR